MEAVVDKILESSMHASIDNYKEFASDLKWYFKEQHNVIQQAIKDLKVTVRYETRYHWIGISLKVNVPNKPSFYEYNCGYSLSEFKHIRKDVVAYKEFLDEWYYKYHDYYIASYKAERKADLQARSEKMAQALIALFSSQGKPQTPTFCSCCGARLNTETHNCDYCGAVWKQP